MEITVSSMYWFTRLDSIATLLNWICAPTFILSVVTGVVSFVFWMVAADSKPGSTDEDKCKMICKKTMKICFCFVVLLFVFLSVKTLVPTQKEAAAIYLIPTIVNNEDVGTIAKQSSEILQLKLNEWIKDISDVRGEIQQ